MVFNLKSMKGKQNFFRETQYTSKFTDCFKSSLSFNEKCNSFFKSINSTVFNCFEKVRITTSKKRKTKDQKESQLISLNLKKNKLSTYLKESKCELGKTIAKSKINSIEKEIIDLISEKNRQKIEDVIKNSEGINGEFCQLNFWKTKQKLLPKSEDPPAAKKDEKGNIITTSSSLKELYRRMYNNRLTPASFDQEEIKKICGK